jgi:hypothetical protein
MMKINQILVLFCFSVLLMQCKKKSSAGLGGNANLNIQAQHHGESLDSMIIFVKFNAQDAPSDDEYELHKMVDKEGKNKNFSQFIGLKKGDYYLFAKGWDASIAKEVKGGIPFKIDDEKNFNIIIPVSENH